MKINFESLYGKVEPTPAGERIAGSPETVREHAAMLMLAIADAKADGVSHYELIETALITFGGKIPDHIHLEEDTDAAETDVEESSTDVQSPKYADDLTTLTEADVESESTENPEIEIAEVNLEGAPGAGETFTPPPGLVTKKGGRKVDGK